MANISRIHCHSAFKHYTMYHWNHESGYGNSVFNTTYNFNGGTTCGGGFWGGLLGGLGMGLGAGLMNFLGGGFNMFGGGMNMFGGGFPMMNMFGGGFNMFGGGFPMIGLLGSKKKVDGAGGKNKNKDNTDNETKKCGGKDGELTEKAKDEPKVEPEKKIEQEKKVEPEKNVEPEKKVEQEKQEKTKLEGLADKKIEDNEHAENAAAKKTEANEKTANPTDLKNKKINELTEVDLKALKDKPDIALEILKNNGRINEGKETTIKVPKNYNELVLAKISGKEVQFCANKASENDSKKSSTIKGKIESDIIPNKDKEKCYSIVIQDKYGKYTLELDYKNNTIDVTNAENAKIEYKDNTGKINKLALNNRRTGDNYKYQIGDDWATRQGKPLMFI